MRQRMTTAEVRLDQGKAAWFSAARRATRRFGCQRDWLWPNSVAARLSETENCPQRTGNPENVGLYGDSAARRSGIIAGTVPPGPARASGRCGNGRFSRNRTLRSSGAEGSSVTAISAPAMLIRALNRRMLAKRPADHTTGQGPVPRTDLAAASGYLRIHIIAFL